MCSGAELWFLSQSWWHQVKQGGLQLLNTNIICNHNRKGQSNIHSSIDQSAPMTEINKHLVETPDSGCRRDGSKTELTEVRTELICEDGCQRTSMKRFSVRLVFKVNWTEEPTWYFTGSSTELYNSHLTCSPSSRLSPGSDDCLEVLFFLVVMIV